MAWASSERTQIGLDFGTTTTLVSVRDPGRRAQVVPLGRSTSWVPSLIGFDERSVLRFGDDAADTAAAYRSVKHAITSRREKISLYCASGDNLEISRTEAISGLLSHVADLAEAAGVPLRTAEVRLGCPAIWDGEQRTLLSDAARQAGLQSAVTDVLDEPIAAALAWADRSHHKSDRVLVFDYGGGTLDIAVVNIEHRNGAPQLTVLSARGIGRAGDELDAAIAQDLRQDLEAVGYDLRQGPNPQFAGGRLLEAATDLKILLSQSTRPELSTTMGPGFESAPALHYSVERLEQAFAGQLRDALEYARAALCEAAIRVGVFDTISALRQAGLVELCRAVGIGTVLLAGGMSKIPAVARAFRAELGDGRVSIESLDPGPALAGAQESVVRGLAVSPALYDSLNLSHPAFDLVLEYKAADGAVVLEVVYQAFTPLFTQSDVMNRDAPDSLGYRYVYDTGELQRDAVGRIYARGVNGTLYPFRLKNGLFEEALVRLSRHSRLQVTLFVNGRIRIDDGTYHVANYRIQRWPMLDRRTRQIVDLEFLPPSFGGGRQDLSQDWWRE